MASRQVVRPRIGERYRFWYRTKLSSFRRKDGGKSYRVSLRPLLIRAFLGGNSPIEFEVYTDEKNGWIILVPLRLAREERGGES